MTWEAADLVVAFAVLAVFLELLPVVQRKIWDIRKVLTGAAMLATAAACGLLLVGWPNIFSALLVFLSLFRLVNNLKILQGRLHEDYLRRTARRTTVYLAGLQGLVLVVWWLQENQLHFDRDAWLTVWMLIGLVSAVVIFYSLLRSLLTSTPRLKSKHFSDKELPTVSICIPARNETAELTRCLQSVLASDYPKLEVLVYDDCSHKQIAATVKEFAQKGVRYIRGDSVRSHWLAKNQAYDILTHHASGDYLMFIGSDVRLGKRALRSLISTMLVRKKHMLSVLPRRFGGGFDVTLLQPMRYWWEMALPRRYLNRPPVLSTCWVITKDALHEFGGFGAVSGKIVPESYFARELVRHDGYSFIRFTEETWVETVKSWSAQRDTAIRVRYPQVRRRPELVALLSLGQIGLMLGPAAVVLYSLFRPVDTVAVWYAVEATLLLLVTHLIIIRVTNPSNWWLGIVNFPLAVITELVIGNVSMWRYEFGTVEWKGRNVCEPALQAIPRLPLLADDV